MKRTLFSLFLILLSTCWLQAQTPVFVQVSTDGAYYGKMSFRELFETSTVARDNWLKICREWQEDLIITLNEGNEHHEWEFGCDKEAHYTATFVLERLSRRGAIMGRLVLEFYSPHYHKLFYETEFNASGDNTQDFTVFTSKAWCKSARQVREQMIKHLDKEFKIQGKRNYRPKLEKRLNKETTVFE